jgi:hypothetical protein
VADGGAVSSGTAPVIHTGDGFEVAFRERGVWVRLWWDPRDDQPPFAQPVRDILHRELFQAPGPLPPLFLDLREAPPAAGFAARLRLGAILADVEAAGIATSVLVGPTNLQARDLHRLIRDRAPRCGRLVLPAARRWRIAAAA